MKKLLFIFALSLSFNTFGQDTLTVKNNHLILNEISSVRFVKTERETIYVGCHTPVNVYLRKQSEFVCIIFENGNKKKYFLKWTDKKNQI